METEEEIIIKSYVKRVMYLEADQQPREKKKPLRCGWMTPQVEQTVKGHELCGGAAGGNRPVALGTLSVRRLESSWNCVNGQKQRTREISS